MVLPKLNHAKENDLKKKQRSTYVGKVTDNLGHL